MIIFRLVPYFSDKKFIIGLVVLVLIKGAVSLIDIVYWTYGSEIFPSEIRGSAMGFGIFIGKFASFLGPICSDVSIKAGLNPIFGPTAVSLLSYFFTYKLKDSLQIMIK